MNKFKRILSLVLLAMGVIVTNTSEAGKIEPVKTTSAVYKTPIVQSANGVYVGTLVGRSFQSVNGKFSSINSLISSKGYIFAVTNAGEFKEELVDGYESADCGGINGIPTLVRFGAINMEAVNVFKIGYNPDPTSPALPLNVTVEPDLYYIPKSSALYLDTVYVYDTNGTKTCVPVLTSNPMMQQMMGTEFYKPISNNPAVTGVNLRTLNSLPKPFDISISY